MKMRTLSLSTLAAFSLLVSACGAKQEVSDAVETIAEEAVAEAEAQSLAAIIAAPHRSEDNRARDQYRHPQETLEFFGLQPDQTVIEIGPGRGWYTEILAPYLAASGHYIAALQDAEGPRASYRAGWDALVNEHADLLSDVPVVTFDPGSKIDLGEDNSADLVLTFRAAHSWVSSGVAEEALAGIFAVLKPGGHLGLVSHRAPEGADPVASARNGYVPEATIVELATAAGFELVGSSEINANPNDTTDHVNGVWSLPPTLRGGDEGREQFLAIGESDRMTLLFRKP